VGTSASTTADVLAPHHAQMLLEESGISEEIVVGRGYRTVDEPEDLKASGFSERQLLTPALEIPLFSLGCEIVNYQIRPDNPRLDEKGKPIKYETPAGSNLVLDCHPYNAAKLMDPREELWITEGSKKCDSGASRGLVVLSLQGVWGWMQDKAPHPDWSRIPLANRAVHLAFDADIVEKKHVQDALHALCAFLWDRRAIPYVIPLEELEEFDDD
jgi:putative DNA primase/helicase